SGSFSSASGAMYLPQLVSRFVNLSAPPMNAVAPRPTRSAQNADPIFRSYFIEYSFALTLCALDERLRPEKPRATLILRCDGAVSLLLDCWKLARAPCSWELKPSGLNGGISW